MELRLANHKDLSQIKLMYEGIIDHMNKNHIQIWDDVYPCEFFYEDIENNRLYILIDNDHILAAFALCESCSGEDYVQWTNKGDRALYIDRFGVCVNHLRKGIGSTTLRKAIAIAREKGVQYLRLFVVDINKPAINLYIKNGFKRVEGIYDEVIDNEFVLHEYGFEIKTCK